MRSCGCGDRSRTSRAGPGRPRRRAARGDAADRGPRLLLAAAQRTVFADQEVEMGALLVGELEEDPLALGILEPLAVALEEEERRPRLELRIGGRQLGIALLQRAEVLLLLLGQLVEHRAAAGVLGL